MKNNFFTIAIDGGSASGKTTGSKFIAKNFGFKLLSSGKLYRYLALSILKNNGKYNYNFINKVAKNISLKKLSSNQLYSPKVTKLASIIAKKNMLDFLLKSSRKILLKKIKKLL